MSQLILMESKSAPAVPLNSGQDEDFSGHDPSYLVTYLLMHVVTQGLYSWVGFSYCGKKQKQKQKQDYELHRAVSA